MILVPFILLIVLHALADGIKNKFVKHTFSALHILGWFGLAFFLTRTDPYISLSEFAEMILIYSLLRYFLFDGVWNAIRRQKIAYIGSTSYYDKILSQVHPSFVLYTKLLAAMVAVALTFT